MTTKPPRQADVSSHLHLSDLQGLAQLITQGTLGVADLAEEVQGRVYQAVAAPFGAAGRVFVDGEAGASGVRKKGITGLVYGSVKGVTRLAGGAVDAVLSRLVPRMGPRASSPQREALLSALNGVLGDQLQDSANPLAIRMSLRRDGISLPLDKAALAQRLPGATGKVLVLLHGLCMNDLQWRSDTPAGPYDHGEELARELGYTPVYLHYNTGLHTWTNGAQLAALLEPLLQAWPQPVQELTLLAHSMGGLVARSACHQAAAGGLRWPGRLKHLVFLGTPHHGAPLEKVGNWVDVQLGSRLLTRPFARIGQIRSVGITDLRHGRVLPGDAPDARRFEDAPDDRPPLPLPAGVASHAVAALLLAPGDGLGPLSPVTDSLSRSLLGDGLVPLDSALGRHADPRHTLAFAPDKQWIAEGMNHMALLRQPEVGRQLVQWLRPPMAS
jgi:hypothetical protein